jgi:hypothetical protein
MPDDTEGLTSGTDGAGNASADDSGGQTRGKLRDFAQTALQSTVDRSIEYVKQGRYDDLDPKMQEFLAVGLETVRPRASDEESEPTGSEEMKRYAEVGKRAMAAKNLAEIEGNVRGKLLNEQRVSDARELFGEFGETEIDLKDWQSVDPTDLKRFPLTGEGTAKWKTAVNQFRKAQYMKMGGAGSSDSAGTVDADRQRAAGARGTPQPRPTATGQSTELARAQAVLKGQGVEEYRESIKARLG